MFIIFGFFLSLFLYSMVKNCFFKVLEKIKDIEYS